MLDDGVWLLLADGFKELEEKKKVSFTPFRTDKVCFYGTIKQKSIPSFPTSSIHKLLYSA
jgi:hypothetical protein